MLIKKVLVANRGEIAIRIFRACTELGIRTVAVYSYEDRLSLHCYKADESYQIGTPGEPVKAYLNIDEIISIAKKNNVDAVHPGYGFLSENYKLAQACKDAGIIFIGPPAEILKKTGDKIFVRNLAQSIGLLVLSGTKQVVPTLSAAETIAEKIGYPIILKAVLGGGGRGIRVVKNKKELNLFFLQTQREAKSAFGSENIYLEKYIENAKHIEVQVLADKYGNLVHLFERDCSIQRRHQKVIEFAPSFLSPDIQQKLYTAALTFCKKLKYQNAGTVEFLCDAKNNFYLIEMNPRIQVEHTVSEIITGVDIVESQIKIASGLSLSEAGIPKQEEIKKRGFAIQCRITTEDPYNNFIPDYGKITAYRSAAGFGIRLDAASAFTGAVITPYYDSLLVKLTSYALDFKDAIKKMLRALSEFRVRGVKTNIPFLENVLNHKTFIEGKCTTTFIDNAPEIFHFIAKSDRATKLLKFISEVTINGNALVKNKKENIKFLSVLVPEVDNEKYPSGTKQTFEKLGAEKFSQWILEQKRTLITDTTFRDAHQSLLATRIRTFDMLAIAEFYAKKNADIFSIEMWGGATFDVAMRFLKECPWERLQRLREKIPNILFQMLLRGSNAVGYTAYADNVLKKFIKEAATYGIDIFRIFDALNWTEQMKIAIEEVRNCGKIAEASICYTGDILNPQKKKYNLKYYVNLAKSLKKLGANIIAIKDMAGLIKPYAAYKLIKAIKEETGLPVHLHTHDTGGVGAASILKAVEANVDIVDCAIASMSGITSQPNLNSIVASLKFQAKDTKLNLQILNEISHYWDKIRDYYYPFESGLRNPTAEVYEHEIPGGQYSNLRTSVEEMGLLPRWLEIKKMYAEVNKMFGDIIKVTPTSKVVGDMAFYMVNNNLTPEMILKIGKDLTFPQPVIDFFAGYLGQPKGGFPKELQKIILKGKKPLTSRPGKYLKAINLEEIKEELERKIKRKVKDYEVLSYILYPAVFIEFNKHLNDFSDVSFIPTPTFLYGMKAGEEIFIEIEKGKRLIIKLLAISEADEEGKRTLFYELNGIPRESTVIDKSLGIKVITHPKAEADNLHHLGAPLSGLLVEVNVKKGQLVKKDDKLFVIEAMKMETNIYAPRDGRVKEVLVNIGTKVESKDLLLVYE